MEAVHSYANGRLSITWSVHGGVPLGAGASVGLCASATTEFTGCTRTAGAIACENSSYGWEFSYKAFQMTAGGAFDFYRECYCATGEEYVSLEGQRVVREG